MQATDPSASTSTPRTAPPPAEPFPTLEEMRAAHASLLTEASGDDGEDLNTEKIADFLRRGQATGRLLDTVEDRSVAQGMLNYWTATLYTQRRRRKAPDSAASDVPNALLANFNVDSIRSTVAAADAIARKWSEDEEDTARRLLLRLVRLIGEDHRYAPETADRHTLESVGERTGAKRILQQLIDVVRLIGVDHRYAPVTADRHTLESVGDGACVKRVLQQLIDAGVIRSDAGADGFALRYEALTRSWPRLRRWLELRARFRDAALFWDRHARDRSALVRGPLLKGAEWYHDLNEIEREFINASITVEREIGRRRATVAVLVAAALGLLAITAVIGWANASRNAAEATKEMNRAQDSARRERDAAAAAREAEATARLALEKAKLESADAVQAQANIEKLQTELAQSQLREATQTAEYWTLQNDVGQAVRSGRISQNAINASQERVEQLTQRSEGVSRLRRIVRPVRPGVSIGLAKSNGGGTLCCVVRGRDDRRYLLSSRYVLDGAIGDEVIQPMKLDAREGTPNPIGKIARLSEGPLKPSSATLVELLPKIAATNKVEISLGITGIAAEAKIDNAITLVGRGSGVKSGRIIRIRDDGMIITSRISSAGDMGAPVLTNEGKLLGMLWGRSKSESQVVPIEPILKELGVTLE